MATKLQAPKTLGHVLHSIEVRAIRATTRAVKRTPANPAGLEHTLEVFFTGYGENDIELVQEQAATMTGEAVPIILAAPIAERLATAEAELVKAF
jgi:hypothetical protein